MVTKFGFVILLVLGVTLLLIDCMSVNTLYKLTQLFNLPMEKLLIVKEKEEGSPMAIKFKLISLLLLGVIILLLTGCSAQQQPEIRSQNLNQEKVDIRVLQDEVKALKDEVKRLNETAYQNRQYIKNLQEIYDYVAEENQIPGTGEEPPYEELQ